MMTDKQVDGDKPASTMDSTEVKDKLNNTAHLKTPTVVVLDEKHDPNNGSCEEIQSSNQDAAPVNEPKRPYTILSEKEKIFTILTVSTINVLVFFSNAMYFPALEPIGKDLKVSMAKMYLTITAYMITQGLAPLFTGFISDTKGRRPVLLTCLLISLAANIGLARQTNLTSLISLRCLQSAGTSGATVVSIATVIDIVTRGERGKYIAYTTMGSTIGGSLGPVLGGVLTQYLGWRSIFWFLAIFTGFVILLIVLFLRETCRAVVGNGSIPAQPWNKTLISGITSVAPAYETKTEFKKRPQIFDSIKIFRDKQMSVLILFWCMVMWGSSIISMSIPTLMTQKYGFNSLQVGLCYIPLATGSITARWSAGKLADWNFRRLARQVGVDVQRNQQTKGDLQKIPLEKVRLQIVFPALYLCCLFLVGYSWVVAYKVHIAAPLVFLFFLGNSMIGATNILGALIMDIQAYQPGMTRAAMSLLRCLPLAGVIAGVNPAVHVIGFGWLGTIFAGSWFFGSSILWVVYLYGQRWRKERESKASKV